MGLERDNTKVDPVASIGDDLRAAFKEVEAGEVQRNAGDIPAVEVPAAETPTAPIDGRSRDESGRFKPAEPIIDRKPAETSAAVPSLAAQPEASAPPAPPPGWSVASKTRFAELPAEVKADIVKREQEVSDGFRQISERFAPYKELDAVLAPRIPEFQAEGFTVPQALERLFAAGDALQQNTHRALLEIANNAGIDLAQLARYQRGGQPAGTGQQPQAGPVDPTVAALMRQVQQLTGYVTENQRSAAQAERADADVQISAFGADPNNVYFENVRPEMAHLLQGGFAETLPQAYQMACQLHPEISAAIINDRVKAELARKQTEQAARVAQARSANGSLTGAPAPGSVGNAAPKDNLRDELVTAFRANRA